MEKILTFPRKSYTFSHSYIKTQFLPTVGYVVHSDTFKALISRTLGMKVDDNIAYRKAILGCGNLNNESLNYVEKLIDKYKEKDLILVREHDPYNIMSTKINSVERFIYSLMLFRNPNYYIQISNNDTFRKHHHNDIVFQKSPFQQFMFIDTLINILKSSDVTEYADLILMEMKYSLGIPSLTLTQCYQLFRTFNKKLVTHVIPRRHGKTIFTILLIALSLVFFPCAQLKMSYIAHTKHLTNAAYKTIRDIVERVCPVFNDAQKTLYDTEHYNNNNNEVNPTDKETNAFYYKCSIQSSDGITISCVFHKLSHKNKYI